MLKTSSPLPTKRVCQETANGRCKQAKRTCQEQGCSKWAQGATDFCIAHGGGKRCTFEGCTKSAAGATDFCKRHGGGRRCTSEGCTKAAAGATDFCIQHGGGRRCIYTNCTKAATGATDFCIQHGGGKRCTFEGCTKSARNRTDFCAKHGGGRRCSYTDCTKAATGATDFCKAHGGGKRCTTEGCTKSARTPTDFCKAHGGGKRCTYEGCTKSAEGATDFCVRHGGGRRCIHANCTKSAVGTTDLCVYHGGGTRCASCSQFSVARQGFLCWTCRKGTERVKQYEHLVEVYLKSYEDTANYSYLDEALPCAPTRRRGDFVYLLLDRLVIVEVDEQAHRFYSRDCECIRVLELHEQGQGRALFLIRFNPLKHLLPSLRQLLLEAFVAPLPETLLRVDFLGYKREYDVVAEVTRIAAERARGLEPRDST